MSEPAAKRSKMSVQVMVNGLPGNMGKEITQAALRAGLEVVPFAVTGPNMPDDVTVAEAGKEVTVSLKTLDEGAEARVKEMLAAAEKEGKVLIAIDFTHPTAVNPNSEFYTKVGIPFVMGTTGGDREKMMEDVKKSKTYALIAPNMSKQIVALQAMMEYMSSEFPSAFGKYTLDIVESHQNGKADTSGTAKEMMSYFNKLKGGAPLGVEEIKKIREPAEQTAFGVPEAHLKGHAWHTYSLRSEDGSVMFQFKHNVNGRRTYAEGVVDAVNYLAGKINAKSEKHLFNMIDVLKEGAMRE